MGTVASIIRQFVKHGAVVTMRHEPDCRVICVERGGEKYERAVGENETPVQAARAVLEDLNFF